MVTSPDGSVFNRIAMGAVVPSWTVTAIGASMAEVSSSSIVIEMVLEMSS